MNKWKINPEILKIPTMYNIGRFVFENDISQMHIK